MLQKNVYSLGVAFNVCAQVLREVDQLHGWSVAHVIMNPFQQALLHLHRKMHEIYVITKGNGQLVLGTNMNNATEIVEVRAGNIIKIKPGVAHKLNNTGPTHLEHLVFALPPFDPNDVHVLEHTPYSMSQRTLGLPPEEECFDGAKILPYAFPDLGMSFAFGRVINDPARRKPAHYHQNIVEHVYVVEGTGVAEINDVDIPLRAGDWTAILPKERHALRNTAPEDMIVVCICTPGFQINDVHYE